MAESSSDNWTVMILVEQNKDLAKNLYYPISSNARLAKVMKDWMSEFDLIEYWVFKSADLTVEYDDKLFLHEIGATIPNTKIITLNAQLSNKPRPVNKLFRCVNEECHPLQVDPQEELHKVLWSVQGKDAVFAYNNKPLPLKEKVNETPLTNEAVICESPKPITVKLSSGESRIFRVPANCLVQHLMEKIYECEKAAFSLLHGERHLHPQESVNGIKEVVLATRTKFIFRVDDHQFINESQADETALPAFLTLSVASRLPDQHKIQVRTVTCVGCHRYIFQADDTDQFHLTEYFEEREPPDAESNLTEVEASLMEYIINFYKNTRRIGTEEPRTRTLRHECRLFHGVCTDRKYDYNESIRMMQEAQRSIDTIDGAIHPLTIENPEIGRNIMCLKTKKGDTESKGKILHESIDADPESHTTINPTEKEVIILRFKNEKLQYKLLEKKVKINDFKTKIDDNVSMISKLENLKHEKDVKITNQQKDIDDNMAKITDLERENLEKDVKIAKLEKAIDKKDAKVADHRTKVSEKEGAIDNLEKSIVRKETKIADLEGKISAKDAKIQNLQECIVEQKKTISDHQKTIQAQKAKITDLEKKIRNGNPGVKLIIHYDASDFTPVMSRPEIQSKGKYPWSKPFIKCQIPTLGAGMTRYKDLREALKPLFNNEIGGITQQRTTVNDTTVTQVTQLATDENVRTGDPSTEFCSEDGRQWSFDEVGKPSSSFVGGSRLLICGGGRRTSFLIRSS